jgi:hypothetical protein
MIGQWDTACLPTYHPTTYRRYWGATGWYYWLMVRTCVVPEGYVLYYSHFVPYPQFWWVNQ